VEQENIIISSVAKKVKELLSSAEAGHDWLHIERVWNNAKVIAKEELSANSFIVQLAALLHDIADAKFNDGDESLGPKIAKQIMDMYGVDPNIQQEVVLIIENMSYKGGFTISDYQSVELDIVRDADRLDAIGAIGIARAFTYGGYKNRRLYDKDVSPKTFESREAYKKHDGPTINHFYEKLLKLKDLMATTKGRQVAIERHQFMELYLKQFAYETDINQNILEKKII
jgi:uncharacterized protein